SIVTGTLFAPVLRDHIEQLNRSLSTRLTVEPIENGYFGGDVSVAGLLTGQDLLAAKDRMKGDFVFIPKTMLKSDEPIMLDGTRLETLRETLGVPIEPVDIDSLVKVLHHYAN